MNAFLRRLIFIVCIGAINLASSIPANGDVVTDWNTAALDAIRAGRTAPPIASRSLAILQVSIYDAVNGIARTHEPYLVQSEASASASREAAASAAAHGTLVNLFPAAASTFDALHAAILAGIPNGPQKTAGIVWGEFVANQILAARSNDGSNAIVQPPGGSGPGVWVPTPPAFLPYLLPQWGFVVPFGMSSSSQFRPPGPPSLDSQQYAADYDEVQGTRRGRRLDAHARPDPDRVILGRRRRHRDASRPLEQYCADYRRRTRQHAGRKRKVVCLIEHRHGRRRHLRLGCQVHLPLLASGDRDCLCRTRTELGVVHRYATVSRLRLGPQHIQRRSRDSAPTVLPHRRAAFHNRLRFFTWRVPQLSDLPRCSGGSGSEPAVRGHSLPIGKRRWLASGHQHRRLDLQPLPAVKGQSPAQVTAESQSSSRKSSIGRDQIVQTRSCRVERRRDPISRRFSLALRNS